MCIRDRNQPNWIKQEWFRNEYVAFLADINLVKTGIRLLLKEYVQGIKALLKTVFYD
jgi:hypothetical protein